MARPRSNFPPAEEIRTLTDASGLIPLRVTPNARGEGMELDPASRRLLIRTTAAPEDGKANDAVCALVAEALGVPRSAVTLVRGGKARDKWVRVAP